MENILERLRFLIDFLLTSLADALLLVGWAYIQYGTSLLLKKIPADAFTNGTMFAFQLILAIATIIPLIIFIRQDLIIMHIKAEKKIKEAKSRMNENG